MYKDLLCKVFGHIFSNWDYPDKNMCIQQRRCMRCDAVEGRLQHRYGNWVEISKCESIRACSVDGAMEKSETHTWETFHDEEVIDYRPGTPDITDMQSLHGLKCKYCPAVKGVTVSEYCV